MHDPTNSEDGPRPPTNEEFAQLLAANQDILLWFIKSLLPGSPDVDDILQNTNLVLWRKQETFQMGTSFLNWARAVARWEVRAWLSKARRQDWLVVNDELTDAIADAIEQQGHNVGASTRLDALAECMRKLKPRDKLLVAYYYQMDKSLKKCAEAFDLSAKSMKSTLHRIRAALRRCVESRLALNQAGK